MNQVNPSGFFLKIRICRQTVQAFWHGFFMGELKGLGGSILKFTKREKTYYAM